MVVSPTCWYWVGAISIPDGYGRFTWQRGGVQRTLAAHRFSLLASGQDIEDQARGVAAVLLGVSASLSHVNILPQGTVAPLV